MKKYILIALSAVALIAFTACEANAAQTTAQAPVEFQLSLEQPSQEQPIAQHTPVAQPQAEQCDTLRRIYNQDYWISGIVGQWANELGMTIDEIFDYVRAATRLDYGFDYLIEGGMDVSGLAARVGETSDGFMSRVHMAYNITRSVDVAHRWAAELDMTADELVDYVFIRGNSHHLAETLGVEWGEFQTVLAGVGNALWQDRVRAHANEESITIVTEWASRLGMTFNEFLDVYNSFDFDWMATVDALGVDFSEFRLIMEATTTFLSSNE